MSVTFDSTVVTRSERLVARDTVGRVVEFGTVAVLAVDDQLGILCKHPFVVFAPMIHFWVFYMPRLIAEVRLQSVEAADAHKIVRYQGMAVNPHPLIRRNAVGRDEGDFFFKSGEME